VLGGVMKTSKLFQFAISAMLGACMIQAAPLVADESNTVEECSKELLIAYFPEPFVKETLKKFNVPQSSWDSIVKDLTGKEADIIKTVEEKAEKMKENPLKDPKHRQEAVKIFRDTLLQTFSDVMKKNGVNDDKQIQSMLDDIQQQKAKRFTHCMEKYKSQMQQNPSAQPSSEQNRPEAAHSGKLFADASTTQAPASTSSKAVNSNDQMKKDQANNDADDDDSDDDDNSDDDY